MTAIAQKPRLSWVDAAKGISIMLVVMMYSAYSVGEDTGQVGILHYIIGFATPFRMPEFFLISGLFLNQVIDRPWERYADRRIVHYLYFYGLWAILHILFKTAIATGDPATAATYALWALVEPYGVLWFIYVLAMVSAATKLLHTLKVPLWAGFALGAVLQMTAIHTGAYAIDQFAAYFVYFFTGYALAPKVFALVDFAVRNKTFAVAGLLTWAIINGALVFWPGYEFHPEHFVMGLAGLPVIHLGLAIAGALALCTMAALLVQFRAMSWLSWMGSKSLVIYLAFALPMSAVRILLIKLGFADATNLLSLTVFGVALVSPLVLYTLIQRTGWGKFLIERPGWAHIPGTPGSSTYISSKAVAIPAE